MTAKTMPGCSWAKRCGLLAVLMLAGSAAWAQQQPNPDPVADNLFPPELVLANQKAIGLDDGQRNYVRAEVLKAQTRFTELQFQLQDAMESLVGLLKQNPVDEAQVMAQLDKVLSAEREVKRTQIALMVRIKNKLTPEQQSRLRQLRGKPPGE
jgi:Spy/CpxP family protein refolding chaperone